MIGDELLRRLAREGDAAHVLLELDRRGMLSRGREYRLETSAAMRLRRAAFKLEATPSPKYGTVVAVSPGGAALRLVDMRYLWARPSDVASGGGPFRATTPSRHDPGRRRDMLAEDD